MTENDAQISPEPTPAQGPYAFSRFAKYVRVLLATLVVILLVWLGFIFPSVEPSSMAIAMAALFILMGSLFYAGGYPSLRIILLLTVSANVYALTINREHVFGETKVDHAMLPSAILFGGLVVATLFEIRNWAAHSSREAMYKVGGWSLMLIPACIYILGIPVYESLMGLAETDAAKQKLEAPNWSFSKEIAFRMAQVAVFVNFTYFGACFGSFLNVVAYSVPRGRSIATRDSACPKCQSKLSRADNLPIFGYINLGGKCRNCLCEIPFRYLLVEIVGVIIVGSLFLYELITGCANVPEAKVYMHTGILWIILYPKWPAIGMFCFHVVWLCWILTLALIELDQQRLKRSLIVFSIALLAIPIMAVLLLQPIPFEKHLPIASMNLNPYIAQAVKLLLGGLVGGVVAVATSRFLSSAKSNSVFITAMVLSGFVLGWQGMIQASVILLAVWVIGLSLSRTSEIARRQPTIVLLVALLLHHPFWKQISLLW